MQTVHVQHSVINLFLRDSEVSQENSSRCICDQAHIYRIEHGTINESVQITRHYNETFWFGYNESDLISHPYCPFEYYVSDTVVYSLDKPEMLCTHNRTGVLCGHCKDNYSLALELSSVWSVPTTTILPWLSLL